MWQNLSVYAQIPGLQYSTSWRRSRQLRCSSRKAPFKAIVIGVFLLCWHGKRPTPITCSKWSIRMLCFLKVSSKCIILASISRHLQLQCSAPIQIQYGYTRHEPFNEASLNKGWINYCQKLAMLSMKNFEKIAISHMLDYPQFVTKRLNVTLLVWTTTEREQQRWSLFILKCSGVCFAKTLAGVLTRDFWILNICFLPKN